MDKELLMIIAISSSVLLYTLGGWKWKGLRRDFLPIILGVLLWFSGQEWWKCLIYIILQDISFRLPYGEKTKWWVKFLVGCSFSLPSLLFGFTIWQLILPLIFISTFILSNIKRISKEFSWKVCESMVGFLIGVIISQFIK